MTLKLEAGKYYRTREGEKVGPIVPRDSLEFPFWDFAKERSYTASGAYFGGSVKDERDLVAEWTDEVQDAAVQAIAAALDVPAEPWPEGRKDDGGKDAWHLLPTDAVRGIVKVLTYGAGKYGDRNWEAGMAWSRCYGALLRHLMAWWEGEGKDPETGKSHLWHAGCCLLFLIAYEIRGIGTDDRPKRS